MCFNCLLRGHPAWRIAKGYSSTGYGLSSAAISCASLHTRLQHVWRMVEKSLQQCSSVYFQAPSGKLVSNLIQVGWSSVLCNAIFLFILFSFFLTKCTLTFQCADTLGEERMQASLVGDNGETYHWKAPKPPVKNSARLCCECNSCDSNFVFLSWFVLQRLALIDFVHTNLLPPSITFYKKSIYFKVFAS